MMNFNLRSGTWGELSKDAELIRREVFIQEQQIAEADEWDDQDATSLHFVVYAQDTESVHPIATARLLKNHSIGRVAVRRAYRGKGIGRHLMLKIIEQAKAERRPYLRLSSQVHAIPFYASLGFVVQGERYMDCGILHQDMMLSL